MFCLPDGIVVTDLMAQVGSGSKHSPKKEKPNSFYSIQVTERKKRNRKAGQEAKNAAAPCSIQDATGSKGPARGTSIRFVPTPSPWQRRLLTFYLFIYIYIFLLRLVRVYNVYDLTYYVPSRVIMLWLDTYMPTKKEKPNWVRDNLLALLWSLLFELFVFILN